MNKIYKRVILKVSGEALMGSGSYGIDPLMVSALVSDISSARSLGIEIALVVGGGNFFRGVDLTEQSGIDRVTGDQMGMLAITMNALALRSAFVGSGIDTVILNGIRMPQICESFSQRAVEDAIQKKQLIIFSGGTGNPFFTSDTGASLRSAEFGAEALIKGTQVDGVYTADPRVDSSAEFLERLTYSEALERHLKFMDSSAISLARTNRIDIIVFNMHKHRFSDILCGEGRYSLVTEDG